MFIQRRFRKLYALHAVPKRVRPIIGKDKFVVSLDTTDPKIAERRAAQHLARWHLEIAQAEARLNGNVNAELIEEAQGWKAWLDQQDDPDNGPSLTDKAQAIEDQHGPDAAKLFMRVADGNGLVIAEQAEVFLAWRAYPARSE